MGIKIVFSLLIATVAFAQSPVKSLDLLVQGNQRYVGDQLLHANRSADRREEIRGGQRPFAVIVGCSDSRVAPEIIFDQGLGDLFIVRIAGNVVGPVELDSIEFAVDQLGSSLILVLGHESCAAVKAVIQGQTADIGAIAELIEPAVQGITDLEEGVKANVKAVVSQLTNTDKIKQLISKKHLNCLGAYYHLGSGQVEILK
jgi:carbonic anhydrase